MSHAIPDFILQYKNVMPQPQDGGIMKYVSLQVDTEKMDKVWLFYLEHKELVYLQTRKHFVYHPSTDLKFISWLNEFEAAMKTTFLGCQESVESVKQFLSVLE